jgi:hypothetical protein
VKGVIIAGVSSTLLASPSARELYFTPTACFEVVRSSLYRSTGEIFTLELRLFLDN